MMLNFDSLGSFRNKSLRVCAPWPFAGGVCSPCQILSLSHSSFTSTLRASFTHMQLAMIMVLGQS